AIDQITTGRATSDSPQSDARALISAQDYGEFSDPRMLAGNSPSMDNRAHDAFPPLQRNRTERLRLAQAPRSRRRP
ncbi:MAG: hypothetical protein KA323_13590, partial [Planctomycetes bacterium]|nr:hypothetical protein [Planctomycetota bacterium]